MIRAFARHARLAGAALFTLALVACNGSGPATPADAFKPVPVTPVLGDVVLGNKESKVTLVEYAAFTCPHCRDFAKQIYPRIKRDYIDTGKIAYIYRDFPLEVGPDGKAGDGFGVVLALVARCKGPDKFYDIVDDIFGNQGDLLEAARDGKALPLVADIATRHGMTIDEMRTCIDHQPELRASIKESRNNGAEKYKIEGTPAIMLNEQHIKDYTYEGLSAAIEALLAGKPLPTESDAANPAAPTSTSTPVPATPAAPTTPPAQ